ncbi:MAG TPA: hypothetical protein VGB30_14145 [bacterium]|jgi:hypothetical protein
MQNVLSLIKSFISEMGGSLAPEAVVEEQQFHVSPAEPMVARDEFYEVPASPGSKMGLQLFQAGVSRTYLVGQIHTDDDVRPVHYASVASVVLHRYNGKMSPYTRPLIADLLLVDLSGIADSEVVERYREGIEIIDCKPANGDLGYKNRRLKAIREAARVQREMQEEGLIACGEGREPGVVIVVDDSLSNIDGAADMSGIVGVVPAEAELLGVGSKVLSCPFMARTALDTKSRPNSFYLRLRESRGSNPDFGLIRVELGKKPDGSNPDEDWASDVASLLVKERFPIDADGLGWDKKIFALQNAGQYIDTLVPPSRVVTTYFGRSSV